MTDLILTFVQPQSLEVSMTREPPELALALKQPAALVASLTKENKALDLKLKTPAALDAALLPVLIGPPGVSGDTQPISPVFTYAGGNLVGIEYADGSTKVFSYSANRLIEIVFNRAGQPSTRKTLAYNPDGTLASILETVI